MGECARDGGERWGERGHGLEWAGRVQVRTNSRVSEGMVSEARLGVVQCSVEVNGRGRMAERQVVALKWVY